MSPGRAAREQHQSSHAVMEARVKALQAHAGFAQHVKYNLSTILHDLKDSKHPEEAAKAFCTAGGVEAITAVLTNRKKKPIPSLITGSCQVLRTIIMLKGLEDEPKSPVIDPKERENEPKRCSIEPKSCSIDVFACAIAQRLTSEADACGAGRAFVPSSPTVRRRSGALDPQMIEMVNEGFLFLSGVTSHVPIVKAGAQAAAAILKYVVIQAPSLLLVCNDYLERLSRTADGREALIEFAVPSLIVGTFRYPVLRGPTGEIGLLKALTALDTIEKYSTTQVSTVSGSRSPVSTVTSSTPTNYVEEILAAVMEAQGNADVKRVGGSLLLNLSAKSLDSSAGCLTSAVNTLIQAVDPVPECIGAMEFLAAIAGTRRGAAAVADAIHTHTCSREDATFNNIISVMLKWSTSQIDFAAIAALRLIQRLSEAGIPRGSTNMPKSPTNIPKSPTTISPVKDLIGSKDSPLNDLLGQLISRDVYGIALLTAKRLDANVSKATAAGLSAANAVYQYSSTSNGAPVCSTSELFSVASSVLDKLAPACRLCSQAALCAAVTCLKDVSEEESANLLKGGGTILKAMENHPDDAYTQELGWKALLLMDRGRGEINKLFGKHGADAVSLMQRSLQAHATNSRVLSQVLIMAKRLAETEESIKHGQNVIHTSTHAHTSKTTVNSSNMRGDTNAKKNGLQSVVEAAEQAVENQRQGSFEDEWNEEDHEEQDLSLENVLLGSGNISLHLPESILNLSPSKDFRQLAEAALNEDDISIHMDTEHAENANVSPTHDDNVSPTQENETDIDIENSIELADVSVHMDTAHTDSIHTDEMHTDSMQNEGSPERTSRNVSPTSEIVSPVHETVEPFIVKDVKKETCDMGVGPDVDPQEDALVRELLSDVSGLLVSIDSRNGQLMVPELCPEVLGNSDAFNAQMKEAGVAASSESILLSHLRNALIGISACQGQLHMYRQINEDFSTTKFDVDAAMDWTMNTLRGEIITATPLVWGGLTKAVQLCQDHAKSENLFKEAHLAIKRSIVELYGEQGVNRQWQPSTGMKEFETAPDFKKKEVLKHLRHLVIAYDNLNEKRRRNLVTALETVKNRELLIRMGQLCVQSELAEQRKTQAKKDLIAAKNRTPQRYVPRRNSNEPPALPKSAPQVRRKTSLTTISTTAASEIGLSSATVKRRSSAIDKTTGLNRAGSASKKAVTEPKTDVTPNIRLCVSNAEKRTNASEQRTPDSEQRTPKGRGRHPRHMSAPVVVTPPPRPPIIRSPWKESESKAISGVDSGDVAERVQIKAVREATDRRRRRSLPV